MSLVDKYIKDIIELLRKCEDIALLDLIYRILYKSL